MVVENGLQINLMFVIVDAQNVQFRGLVMATLFLKSLIGMRNQPFFLLLELVECFVHRCRYNADLDLRFFDHMIGHINNWTHGKLARELLVAEASRPQIGERPLEEL